MQKEFSGQIDNLVKCRTGDEFESLRRMYEIELQKVTEPNRYKLLDWTLAEVGLGYTEGPLVITEHDTRWNAVSMWKRVHFRMSSPTNTLKATHDHLKGELRGF
jgi:hypothetical protein